MLFHPNGREVAIEGESGAVQLWDLAGGQSKFIELQHDNDVRNALFYANDSRCISVDVSGVAKLWNVLTGEQIGQSLRHDDAILECAVSPNGKMIATVGLDEAARVWDSDTGQPIGLPLPHESSVWELAFSPDSQHLVTGSENGEVVCWKITANTNDAPIPMFTVKQAEKIQRVVFDSTGKLIASSSIDGTTRCWDATSGLIKFGPFKQPHGEALDCLFLENDRIATAGDDQTIRIWRMSDGTQLQSLACDAAVLRLKRAPSGDMISSDMSGTTKVWTEENESFSLKAVYKSRQVKFAYHASQGSDERLIINAGGNQLNAPDAPQIGAAIMYRADDGSRLSPPFEHWAPIRRVNFNRQSNRMLTSSEDTTARLWTIESVQGPVADLVRVFQLYRQIKSNEDGKLELMPVAEQIEELENLRGAYADYFDTTPTEIENWGKRLERTSNGLQNVMMKEPNGND